MQKYPLIIDVKLESCCKESLEQIETAIKSGKIISYILPGVVLFQIFSGNRFIPDAISVATTDWEGIAKALTALPKITKATCRDIAKFEMLIKHSLGGELYNFWEGVYNLF